MNILLKFLSKGTSESSLRLKTVISVVSCCIAILIIVIGEVCRSQREWVGAAAAITALGVIIIGVIWGKNQSQKLEK